MMSAVGFSHFENLRDSFGNVNPEFEQSRLYFFNKRGSVCFSWVSSRFVMSLSANSNFTSTSGAPSSLVLIGEGSAFQEKLCAMVERAQMFKDFTRQEIQTLCNYARAYEVEQGNAVFREGEKGTFLCLLVDGRIDIYKESDSRELKKITTIRPGKTMGEMSVIDDMPYSATAIAAEKVTLVLITKMNFDRLLDEQPLLGIKMFKQIARLISLRLRQTTGVLLDYLS